MLMVFTGNGKGKTTAAIGQAIRAVGQGKRVFMMQFIKSAGYPSGEDEILPLLGSRKGAAGSLHFEKGGLGFVGILGDATPFEEHRAAARKALAKARDAAESGMYDLIVLDEVNVALDLHLLELEEALALLDAAPPETDIIFTGRNAHSEILFRADLATRCEELSHPYRHHAPARRGIEY